MLPGWLYSPPTSTFFIIAISVTVSLATTLLNRRFIDKEKFAIWQREINRWNAEKKRAMKTKDKKLLAKVKKQEARMLQLQSKMSSQQLKTSMITFIPMLIMWQILAGFYGNVAVAHLPGLFIGQTIPLTFFLWYMISAFFANTLVSRLLGVSLGASMGLGKPSE